MDSVEIRLTAGAIKSGYLMVDKRVFPQDTWAEPNQTTAARTFSIRLEATGTKYQTDYDLGHRIVRKRFGRFYRGNHLRPGDMIRLFRIGDHEYVLSLKRDSVIPEFESRPSVDAQPIVSNAEVSGDDLGQMQDTAELIEDNVEDDAAELNIDPRDRRILYVTKNPTISSLWENYLDGDLILNPDYQRYYVWDRQKASNLIESVILDIPIPVIFTSEEEDGVTEEVIDGQQRLQSIFSFIKGEFPDKSPFKLSKLKILKELSGSTYAKLDASIQKRIKKRELTVVRIQSGTQKDIKFEMFERLNTNITRLNAQELRNCLYRGPYMEFIKKMAKNQDFIAIIDQKDSDNKRMLHEELVLIFFSFLHKSYLHYYTPLKQFLNDDTYQYRHADESELSKLEAQFKKSVDIIKTVFGRNAFKVFLIDPDTGRGYFSKTKINQGLYFVLTYCFALYEKNQIMPYSDLIREELINLQVHNAEFLDTLTGSGTNSREKIQKKFDLWRGTLKGILGYPVKHPRAFSYQLKKQLFEQNPVCDLCGQRVMGIDDCELDHITAYSRGGKTIASNARVSHRFCNRSRGAHKAGVDIGTSISK